MTTAGLQLGGMHHVSAISAHIGGSNDFYTRVLGMRPIIRTVNQDSPTMYHLFFGDGAGTPGSDMTIFDIPRAAIEHRGNNSITLTSFRIAGDDSFAYWTQRLDDHGVAAVPGSRDGRRVIDFDDPEGTPLSLIDDRGEGAAYPWNDGPVPPAHQIRGLGYTTITVPALQPTHEFLAEALGLTHDRTYPVPGAPRFQVHVYAIGAGGPHAEVHVAVRDDLPRARPGAGGVHHVALRVPEGQGIADWAGRLNAYGYGNSGVVDRHYFASVYVREPNHVLFELATDGPGFEVDGPIDADRLSLPPFLEPRRAEIEAALKPLHSTDVARA